MTRQPQSCDLRISATGATLNAIPLAKSTPVATFHAWLGPPTRIVSAGGPAPVGHRNNHIHYYDHLGLTLNEHHFTHQIEELTLTLNVQEASLPAERCFSGTLWLGGVRLSAGDPESLLRTCDIPLQSQWAGDWYAWIRSQPTDGYPIYVAITAMGRKLPSGRRSRVRHLVRLSLGLEHDPWDPSHRPQ